MGITKRSVEQLGDLCSYARGWKRWYKRMTSKLMRRLGRADLDEAPRRTPFRGWTD